jgi:hypothetical protein
LAKRLILALVFLAASASPSFGEVRWMGKAEGKKALGGWVKDVSGPPGRGYWAGEVEEIEIDDTGSGFTLTGRVKVKITWITDRTSYRCHEIYIVNSSDCEDFNYRSLMLSECQ